MMISNACERTCIFWPKVHPYADSPNEAPS